MIKLHTDTGAARLYELEDGKLSVLVTDFGAAIYAVRIDRGGELLDIALRCEDTDAFMDNRCYFGATVGRTANRIKDGRFSIDGREYQLTKNEGNNNVHGGNTGFSAKRWKSRIEGDTLVLSLRSADGEEGYPGNLDVTVRYSLDGEGGIVIEHSAVCDADTVVNLTNHTYWCLDGIGKKIYEQTLAVNAKEYLETDDELIPTGRILPVTNTPYDFSTPHAIGERIGDGLHSVRRNNGYDVSYVRLPSGDGYAAALSSACSGVKLKVYTSYPDIHVYTGNYLDNEPGVNGVRYRPHDAICLEPSYFPDAVNHEGFGKFILRKGELLKEHIVYKVTVS